MIVLYPNFVSNGVKWSFVNSKNKSSALQLKIHGIDVSRHNGDIQWAQLNETRADKDRIEFVFMKATEGLDLVDKKFYENWDNAQRSGLYRGAYHFYLVGKDPKLQALNFILHVKREKGTLRPVVDFETLNGRQYSKERVQNDLKVFLDIVGNAFSCKPIIYTNYPLYQNIIKGNLDEYPIWLSDFNSNNLTYFEGEKPIFWQYSEKGRIPGLNSYVDLNVFLGSKHKFLKYIQ